MDKTIRFLQCNSCPSIQYRLEKEILKQREIPKDHQWQAQILTDPAIIKFLDMQQENGWIAQDFHSSDGIETAVRVFAEKGVSADHPAIHKMLSALEEKQDTFDQGSLQRVGKILDQKHLGGSQLIRATVFSYMGIENKPFIQNQIKKALESFAFVLQVNQIEDITEVYKNQLVFKQGVKWPSIYDLRLLAFTSSWRSPNNQNIMKRAIQRLIILSPIPSILVLEKKQLIAPASSFMKDFKVNTFPKQNKDWMIWFHQLELLTRLGLAKEIEELNEATQALRVKLDENDGLFTKRLAHYYFTSWSPYTGLALEKDWRSPKRRLSDLTFRSLLILTLSS
ncbi:hypothetical protein [Amphibacillus sediminis]|uniref:hypothetical protein n=1 Tax=Amphibacillus sediminis TaxID=360185 RepID=UPI000835B992|nr:hypothetical protein [Amphibacillus sediminis]